jgi:hypothetical protein
MRLPSEYLSDAYVEMVGQLFGDVLNGPSFCASEFMISHGHLMCDTQKKALSAFSEFWEALEELEDTHDAIERKAEEEREAQQ